MLGVDPDAKALAACVLAGTALVMLSGARALTADAPSIEVVAVELQPAPEPRRVALVAYLADRYRVDAERMRVFVDEAHAAAEEFRVDPLLVLAVMGVESSFNPAARSGFGARGLMQVVPRFHSDKLAPHGGAAALLDPRINTLVGTQILEECMRRTGNLPAGLQRYAGWQHDDERRYAHKVITERQRLRRAVRQTPDQRAKSPVPRQGAAHGGL